MTAQESSIEMSSFSLPEPKQYPGYEIEVFESEGGCCNGECTICAEIVEKETEQSGENDGRSVSKSCGTEKTQARQS
jgi:hypothetical protein